MPVLEINTNKDTGFYKSWYSPYTRFDSIIPNLIKLPQYYSFDLEKLKEQVCCIKSEYGFKPFPIKKDGSKVRRTYQGIGLTAKEGASDPLYDALRLYGNNGELDITDVFLKQSNSNEQKEFSTLSEKDFNVKTEIFTGYIAEILSRFMSPLTKTRLLCLKPKGMIAPHVDFPYYEQIRVHACIESNDNTWWEVDGERFQIPCDGNFYWFDTGKYHAVWNDGKTDRTVLSVNLSVYKDNNNNILHDSSSSLEQLILSGLV